jgi:repressor LexA
MTRRDRVLKYIQDHVREVGYAPSIREIRDAVGLKSISTVKLHLDTLKKARQDTD